MFLYVECVVYRTSGHIKNYGTGLCRLLITWFYFLFLYFPAAIMVTLSTDRSLSGDRSSGELKQPLKYKWFVCCCTSFETEKSIA